MYVPKIKKFFLTAVLVVINITVPLCADGTKKVQCSSWKEVVQHMEVHLNNACDLYLQGQNKKAYDEVNAAYFRFYESKGMEKITMSYISGARKTAVENAFYQYRKDVKSGTDAEVVKKHRDELIAILYQDAAQLDGTSSKKSNTKTAVLSTFISCFVLILREGLEAILVIAAIIAYLIKTGKKRYIFDVYIGAVAGIVISIILAFLFNMIAGAQSGIAREIFEGIGMFVAVVVLFYVSNWMLSKSQAEAWDRYIKKQVEASVSTGNRWVLIFTAFIAVAREGAELILFFQGVPVHGSSGRMAMILAIVLGTVLLAVVFVVFRFVTVKLPLKPFFIFTSVLMYVLCFSFTGKGVGELQAAGVVSKTVIPAMHGFEIDLLGIYDNYESIIPQIIVLVITIVTAVIYSKKNKAALAALKSEETADV